MPQHCDVIIIGGGIAGASLAYFLAGKQQVVLLERESHVGYHTTGRSAAVYTPDHGAPLVRQLSHASFAILSDPPAGFAGQPLLSRRGQLLVANEEGAERLRSYAHSVAEQGGRLAGISLSDARRLLPILREEALAAAFHDPDICDIDVDALHQGFLRSARASGLTLVTEADVTGIDAAGSSWRIRTSQGQWIAPIVVNAAGAWADTVATMAGLLPLGLIPKRRTMVLVDPPPSHDIHSWPLTVDFGTGFYMKPDAGRLLASPIDATPSEPCDAQPEELDVAICIDRLQQMLDLPVRRVFKAWAGLRSFLPDEEPVAGFEPRAPGFFWLAGQGGFGIQSAPALGAAAAAILLGRNLPDHLLAHGISADRLGPGRLRASRKETSAA